MEYVRQGGANGDTFQFSGRWTFQDHRKMVEISTSLKDYSGDKIVFDFANVEFLDSAGLGMLLLVRDTGDARGFKIVFRAVPEAVSRVMKMAKFDTVFTIED